MKENFLTANIKAILALVVVVLGISYFYMCSIRNIKPDPQILIAIVGSLGTCLGYYFGSSQGSSKKDDALVANSSNPVATTNSGDVTVKQ